MLDEESDEDLNSDCGISRVDEEQQAIEKIMLMAADSEYRILEPEFESDQL